MGHGHLVPDSRVSVYVSVCVFHLHAIIVDVPLSSPELSGRLETFFMTSREGLHTLE